MLFALKRRASWSLIATAILAGASGLLRQSVGLPPIPTSEGANWLVWTLGGGLLLAASDASIHSLLSHFGGATYRRHYSALIFTFTHQRWNAMLAAGALAASEEFLFRGALLEIARNRLAWPAWLAIATAASAFALAHILPDRKRAPFALWALWEGFLLGGIFSVSGSLLAVCLIHAAHDVAGFWVFARMRRVRWNRPIQP